MGPEAAAWALGIYAGMSVVAAVAALLDKRAARRGTWRTRERTLHVLDLLGGWPGGVATRRLIRHKTRDLRFRVWTWGIVTAHVAAWAWLAWERLR